MNITHYVYTMRSISFYLGVGMRFVRRISKAMLGFTKNITFFRKEIDLGKCFLTNITLFGLNKYIFGK